MYYAYAPACYSVRVFHTMMYMHTDWVGKVCKCTYMSSVGTGTQSIRVPFSVQVKKNVASDALIILGTGETLHL
jgi:hypothetical protein